GEGEPGVPGALVVFEDGRSAVTDVSGRWHLDAVRPGLKVARIDPASLPPPLAPACGGGDWAGDCDSRDVEARAAGLAVPDFPVKPGRAPRCTLSSGHGRLILPLAALDPSGTAGSARAHAVLEAAAAYVVDQGETFPGSVTLVCDGDGPEAASW